MDVTDPQQLWHTELLALQCHLSSSFPKEETIGVFPLSAIHCEFWCFFLPFSSDSFCCFQGMILMLYISFCVCGSDGFVSAPLSICRFFFQSPKECVFLQAPVGGCFSFLFEKRLSIPIWPEIVELFIVKFRQLWLQNLLFQTYEYRIVGVSFCNLLILQ